MNVETFTSRELFLYGVLSLMLGSIAVKVGYENFKRVASNNSSKEIELRDINAVCFFFLVWGVGAILGGFGWYLLFVLFRGFE